MLYSTRIYFKNIFFQKKNEKQLDFIGLLVIIQYKPIIV